MITETNVVNAVRRHLESQGWTIDDYCLPTQTGDDIVAKRAGQEFRIEAKGEGSEQPTSSRYGHPFTRNQVRSHVAVAFYRAAKMRTEKVRAGMAFPDNEHHREMVAAVEQAINDLELAVLWVDERGTVKSSD